MKSYHILLSLLVMSCVLGCSNKAIVRKKILLSADEKASSNVVDLLKSDSGEAYSFCNEGSNNLQNSNQTSALCKLTPITSLYLISGSNKKYKLEIDSNFQMSLVYKSDSLAGIIKAKKVNAKYEVVSQISLKKEDGSINGFSVRVLLDLLERGSKIYTIRYNEEHFVYGHSDNEDLKVTSFANGNIENYNSVSDWVKAKFQ